MKEGNMQVDTSYDIYKTTGITDMNYCFSQNNTQQNRPRKFLTRNWCKIVSRDPLL